MRSQEHAASINPIHRSIAYASFVWMILFGAGHVYSALGGYYAISSDPGTNNPDDMEMAANIIVTIMCAAGAFVSLASVRPWGTIVPRWIVLVPVWAGCIFLVLRGGGGALDQLLRMTGIMPDGIFGTTGSTYVIWAGRIFDAYVVLGAFLFVTTARIYLKRRKAAVR